MALAALTLVSAALYQTPLKISPVSEEGLVFLGLREASRKWEISRIPYKHAIAAIHDMADNVNGRDMWAKFECLITLLPSKVNPQIGRPPKKRKKSTGEIEMVKGNKLTRKGKIVTCSLCKATWHNKRVCKANVSSDGGQRATTVPKKTVGRKRSISQPRNEAATQGSQASAGSTFKRTKMTASRLTPDKIKEMKLKILRSLIELLLLVQELGLPKGLSLMCLIPVSTIGVLRSTGGPTLVCENCGYSGHTVERCFKLIGYAADFGKKNNGSNTNQNTQNFNRRFMNNNNSVGSSSSSSLSDEQISKLLSLIKDNSLNDKGKSVQANMTGANQHLTYTDKNLVNVIDIFYLIIRVSRPNGTEALITKVARDSKFIVGFDESKCFLMAQDLMDVKLMGIGKQVNGLYYFNNQEGNLFKNNVPSSLNTKLNWHNRLGHPSDQHKSTVLSELVHLDLWGPYKVESKEVRRLPSSVLKGKSPYELVFNKKPSLNHLKVFGCLCFATILNSHDKFSSRAEKYVLIGYSSFKKGYKLFIMTHVNFFDEVVHEGPDISNDDTSLNAHDQSDGSNSSKFSNPTIDQFEGEMGHSQGSNGSASKSEKVSTSDHNTTLSEDDIADDQTTEHIQILNNQPLIRSERASVFSKKYNEYIVDSKVKYGLEKYVGYSNLTSENFYFTTELNKAFEPKNYWEALGRKSIGGKWVFKIKYKSNVEIERYKARYIVKGYNQKKRIDFDETFSPVVKIVTVRCVINLAVQNGWDVVLA
ncbi:ribonuclease H-like domain-containing protein [Tanacetum coccineum]